jgi:hypothetical protein
MIGDARLATETDERALAMGREGRREPQFSGTEAGGSILSGLSGGALSMGRVRRIWLPDPLTSSKVS